ncbi:protein arginine methyltransferase NDUFAF7 homolog, mitochondrial [Ochlerotatus camptorhynchus]|uniref:protein arginine methyltransferase NDUFAF7 homolog, mitochondrial n=1 Tax=Ochlerotatus camptorhynchus TaxID=644619 RepID=UPI0031DFDEAF
MNLQIIPRLFCQQARKYSYKPVKRVSLPPASKLPPKPDHQSGNLSLINDLKSRILATGPIPVAAYMKQVLTNPAAGYYMTTGDVLGKKGDFITSPEIGQIFGEMIAVWCVNEWSKFGRPAPFQLIELGPGKGTMMRDILRVFDTLKVSQGLAVQMVEMSEHLSEVQAKLLCRSSTEYTDKPYYRAGVTASGTKVYWYRQLTDVPEGFAIFLAHEFFDALPIHKFMKQENVWKEVLVDIEPKSEDKFRFILSKSETPMLRLFLNNYPDLVKDRNHIEISFEVESVIRQIGERFHANGGFALVVDYGHLGDKGDTFRAFKNHKLHDPLVEPGSADLTADVDFRMLNRFCEDTAQMVTIGPTSQRTFLEAAGANERLKILMSSSSISEGDKQRLQDGFKMLTDPEQMGERFKFFGLYPKELESFIKEK